MSGIDTVILQRNKIVTWILLSLDVVFTSFLLLTGSYDGLWTMVPSLLFAIALAVCNQRKWLVRQIPYVFTGIMLLLLFTSIYKFTDGAPSLAAYFLISSLLMLYPTYKPIMLFGIINLIGYNALVLAHGGSLSAEMSNTIILVFYTLLTTVAARMSEQLFVRSEQRSVEANASRAQVELIFGEVKQSIGVLNEFYSSLMKNVNHSSQLTKEITIGFSEVAKGIESQATSIAGISETIKDSNGDIRIMADSSQQMKRLSDQTATATLTGNAQVEQLTLQIAQVHAIVQDIVVTMNNLNEQNQRIGDMSSVIADIANQTNLLALNAAIEAARAGEHGKGFHIVSSEVRKLAEHSRQSAETISDILEDMNGRTQALMTQVSKGTKAIEESRMTASQSERVLRDISDNARQALSQAAEVEGKTESFRRSSDSIVDEVTSISSVTEQSTAAVQQILASMEDQRQLSDEIVRSFSRLEEIVGKLTKLAS